jgi:hypothetical protein
VRDREGSYSLEGRWLSGLGRRGIAFYFVRAARDRIGDIVADILTFPREIVDCRTDTSTGLLVLVGCALTKISRRTGHALRELSRQPWHQQYGQAGSNEGACQQPDGEAVVSRFLCVCLHLQYSCVMTLRRGPTGTVFTTAQRM